MVTEKTRAIIFNNIVLYANAAAAFSSKIHLIVKLFYETRLSTIRSYLINQISVVCASFRSALGRRVFVFYSSYTKRICLGLFAVLYECKGN